MGIPELWNLFDQSPTPVAEVRSLADLSAEFFQKHGRPMRIAVDEAGWRFKNLNEKQVEFIRSSTIVQFT
jgi:Holliday junction resolvase YEN1